MLQVQLTADQRTSIEGWTYGRGKNPRLRGRTDLTNHGNPKLHPLVPHFHRWYPRQNRFGPGRDIMDVLMPH